MYRVLERFSDLTDGGHVYKIGDRYPRKGLDVTDARLKELQSAENRRKKPLIFALEEEPKEETVPQKPKTPKTRTKTPKKR